MAQQRKDWLPFTSPCEKVQHKVSEWQFKTWNETKYSSEGAEFQKDLHLTARRVHFLFENADGIRREESAKIY